MVNMLKKKNLGCQNFFFTILKLSEIAFLKIILMYLKTVCKQIHTGLYNKIIEIYQTCNVCLKSLIKYLQPDYQNLHDNKSPTWAQIKYPCSVGRFPDKTPNYSAASFNLSLRVERILVNTNLRLSSALQSSSMSRCYRSGFPCG